jgi:hypothetical protein
MLATRDMPTLSGGFTFEYSNRTGIQSFLYEKGNVPIQAIDVCRQPIESTIYNTLNLLSLGRLSTSLKDRDYDNLYHLFMLVLLVDGTKFIIEKNAVVEVSLDVNRLPKTGTCMNVLSEHISGLTLRIMIDKANGGQGPTFWKYDAHDNNCQVFVTNMLKYSGLGTDALYKFIRQDLDGLLIDPIWKLTRGITDITSVYKKIVYGLSD